MNNIEYTEPNDIRSINSVQLIDVLAVVDVQAIKNDLGNSISKEPGAPTVMDDKYIYYITSQNNIYVPKNNAQATLLIEGKVGDIVRWRASTLSAQFDDQVFLYHMAGVGAKSLVSPPTLTSAISQVAAPSKEATLGTNQDYPVVLETRNIFNQGSKLRTPGIAKYSWYISIFERWNVKDNIGNLVGYLAHSLNVQVVD
ncbi:AidA/PixA family protein [Photorhabdus luminescens]|uniref:AidA/PixA family protein n=1 Tax=Photorhabdus luminescens TaxID=29488 RepID=UPI0022405C0B|nr:AidA/PixA family protein [Photorhabdus luminescens]MCW7763657.1 inclusion body family protein [Photorhabdus luminescens subsp. venezuelensis]